MSPISHDAARERLLDQVFDARTHAEIAAARQALHAWLVAHPDEPGMSDAFEVLSHREDLINDSEGRSVTKQPAVIR